MTCGSAAIGQLRSITFPLGRRRTRINTPELCGRAGVVVDYLIPGFPERTGDNGGDGHGLGLGGRL
jgi:hypothetical protein